MPTKKFHVDLPEDDVDWFREKYEGASLGWMLGMLLQKYRESVDKTPEDYAKIAAEKLKEEMGQ